jgi:hypothetical protein
VKLIEKDENRARVVGGNYIPVIMSYLSDPDMVPFAVPVLYNIMVDYGMKLLDKTEDLR